MPREEEMEQDFDEKLVLDEIQKQQLQEHGADEEEEEVDDEGSSTTSPTADGAAPKKTKKLTKQQIKEIKQESSPEALKNDILLVEDSIEVFLQNRFNKAEEMLESKLGKNMYFTLGYGVLQYLKSMMTFDPLDIDIALKNLKLASEISNVLRKKDSPTVPESTTSSSGGFMSSFGGIVRGIGSAMTTPKEGAYLKEFNLVQKHAELIYAEATLLRSLLVLITQKNLVAFVKEGLTIRSSYNTLRGFYKFLERLYDEEGIAGFEKHGIDEHLASGVLNMIGCFNLILSLMPSKILKIFELIGFSGDRDFAIERLETCGRWTAVDATKSNKKASKTPFGMPPLKSKSGGLRSFLAHLYLLVYNIVLPLAFPVADCNLPRAKAMLLKILEKRPNSFIFCALYSRCLETEGNPVEAEKEYMKVMNIQKDWRQLIHVCLWDLGVIRFILGKYAESEEVYSTLYAESKWSPAVYKYLQSAMVLGQIHQNQILLSKVGDDAAKQKKLTDLIEKDKLRVVEMMKQVPDVRKKIAGKSFPMEKFVIRKSRKFFLQGDQLFLPHFEIMYFLHAFEMMDNVNLKKASSIIDAELRRLENQLEEFKKTNPTSLVTPKNTSKNKKDTYTLPYSTFYDDLVLARFLKGVCECEKVLPFAKTLDHIAKQVEAGKLYSNALVNGIYPDVEIEGLNKTSIGNIQYCISNFDAVLVQSPMIELDHWLLPFSRYEKGSLYMRCGRYDAARKEILAALNGGVSKAAEDGETSILEEGKKTSMEATLSIRCHNALIKLAVMEDLVGKK